MEINKVFELNDTWEIRSGKIAVVGLPRRAYVYTAITYTRYNTD